LSEHSGESAVLPSRDEARDRLPGVRPTGPHLLRDARGGTAAARLRVLQGKRARLDSASAVVKFTSGVIQDCLAGTIEVEIARTTLYGLSVQLKAIELAEAATARHLVDEVARLTREARRGA
jgi:hypothetical protein